MKLTLSTIHICFLVWASSISISKWAVFACLRTGDLRGHAESTNRDRVWKLLRSSLTEDLANPWKNDSLLRSEWRKFCLLNIVQTGWRIYPVNRLVSQVPCHPDSPVLFSRLENNADLISIYSTIEKSVVWRIVLPASELFPPFISDS